jgi:nucleotide-binding universal stress UspA family protein
MFKPQRILHPTDFSAHSDAAFVLACSLARDSKAAVLVLHVVPPPITYDDVAESRQEGYRENLRDELHRVNAEGLPLGVVHLLLDGDPATVILETAANHGADLIVLGTHGRSGVGRLLMGSVAEKVLRKANCPVLIVKAPHLPSNPDQAIELAGVTSQ